MNTWTVLLIVVGVAGTALSQSWRYNDQQAWSRDYPMCNGSFQSPIRINVRETTMKSYPAISFINYNQTLNVEIKNNGYTAEIDYPESNEKPQIRGGPLPPGSSFELANVHFHWGANDTLGAEHVIDMQRYAMEVHTVHYNMKYSNVDQALNYSDGIAVVTVFYIANPTMVLAGLQPVTKALPQIINRDDETVVENFNLSALIGGPDQRNYLTYTGSLTTPPCSEAVTWIIYPKPVSVNPEQLQSFRALKDKDGNPLVNNFRQLQKRNRRKIYRGRNKRTFPFMSTDTEM